MYRPPVAGLAVSGEERPVWMAERRLINADCDGFCDKRPRLRRAWYAWSRDVVVVNDGMLEYRERSTRVRDVCVVSRCAQRLCRTMSTVSQNQSCNTSPHCKNFEIGWRKSVVYKTSHPHSRHVCGSDEVAFCYRTSATVKANKK
jgi:hypothetical protein